MAASARYASRPVWWWSGTPMPSRPASSTSRANSASPGSGAPTGTRIATSRRLTVAPPRPQPLARTAVEQLLLGVAQVLLEIGCGTGDVAVVEEDEQVAVAGHVGLVQLLRARHGVEREPQLGEQAGRDLVEPAAARERHEVGVEAHVRRADGDPVAAGGRGLAARDVVVQRAQPVGLEVAQRADDVALDGAAQPVEVDQVGLVELGDEDAAVQVVHEQALVGEQPERLAQGVARDAQRADEQLLRQPGAGRRGRPR